jgi:transcriptional regulator with XRE-family HTH domain
MLSKRWSPFPLTDAIRHAKQGDMTVGQRIAAWRKVRDVSQRELAAAIGVTQGAIAQWESGGKTMPSIEKLEKAVAALGLTMERFYGRVPKVKVEP